MVQLERVNWEEHSPVGGGRGARMIFDRHEGDDVMGEAEVDFLVEGDFAEADRDRDEHAFRKKRSRGAASEVGVEFMDIG